MRAFGVALLAFLSMPAVAGDEPRDPRAIVFLKECREIDPKVSGFACHFDREGMRVNWTEQTEKMPPDRRERARYDFSRIALRYIELGGVHFTVRFAHLPQKVRNCWRRKNARQADYYCVDD